jgi:hypothetical protein
MNTSPFDDEAKPALPFKKMSQTRWLARGQVMMNILQNWDLLKEYFNAVKNSGPQEARAKASGLSTFFNDPVTYLYLVFAAPLIKDCEGLNRTFQADFVDPEKSNTELDVFYQALRGRVFDEQGRQKSASEVDYGDSFEEQSWKFLESEAPVSRPKLELEIAKMKQRCSDLMVEMLVQMDSRLQGNKSMFKGMSYLQPGKVLSHTARAKFGDLPMRCLRDQAVEQEYRQIVCQNWLFEEIFKDGIPTDCVLFWSRILEFSGNAGKHPYAKLAEYALNCLILPTSNAFAERIFSVMSFMKNKLRNGMSSRLLDSIIRVRMMLAASNKCCRDFKVTDDMLEKFNTSMYITTQEDSVENEDLSVFDLL